MADRDQKTSGATDGGQGGMSGSSSSANRDLGGSSQGDGQAGAPDEDGSIQATPDGSQGNGGYGGTSDASGGSQGGKRADGSPGGASGGKH